MIIEDKIELTMVTHEEQEEDIIDELELDTIELGDSDEETEETDSVLIDDIQSDTTAGMLSEFPIDWSKTSRGSGLYLFSIYFVFIFLILKYIYSDYQATNS